MNLELYNKELIANLSEIYSLVPVPVMSVYRAAKKYYGEDNVELTIGYDAYCKNMYWNSFTRTNNPLDCLDGIFPEQQGFDGNPVFSGPAGDWEQCLLRLRRPDGDQLAGKSGNDR